MLFWCGTRFRWLGALLLHSALNSDAFEHYRAFMAAVDADIWASKFPNYGSNLSQIALLIG